MSLDLPFAAVCGAAIALGFAPWSYCALAAIGMLCTGLLFSGANTPVRAGLRGFATALGLMATGTAWILSGIASGAAQVPWLIPFILTGYLGLSALPYGLACFLGAILVPLDKAGIRAACVRTLLVLPAIWTLAEWLRTIGPFALPWMLTGTAQASEGWLAGWLSVLGTLGTGWLAWTVAGACICLLAMLRAQRWRAAMLLSLAIVAATGASHALTGELWTAPEPVPLQVRLWQTNHPQHEKWDHAIADATANALLDWVEHAPPHSVLLTPELVMVYPWHTLPAAWVARLKRSLAERDNTLLLGIVGSSEHTRRLFNTLIAIGPHTEHADLQVYGKERLVAFGEALPGKQWLGWFYKHAFAWPLGDLSTPLAEENSRLLYADGHALAAAICFESGFTRDGAQRDPQAAFLANPSNDAWFDSQAYQAQALQIAQAAAMETGKPVLRANNVGYTALIRADGTLQDVLPLGTSGELAGTVFGRRGHTPFAAIGEPLIIGLCCVVLCLARALARRGRRSLFNLRGIDS